MAKYSPKHLSSPVKTVNVRGVANRAVAAVLTAGLIAQPLMSPLAAIAAPAGDSTDAVKGESPHREHRRCRQPGGREDGGAAGRGIGKAV